MDVELVELGEPRFVELATMRIAGLAADYTRETTGEIPKQWDRFNAELFAAGLAENVTYGVVYPLETMRYITGVEVNGEDFPASWMEVTVTGQRYAVFAETGGIPMMRRAWVTIFQHWLPKSGWKKAEGPMLEKYQADWSTTGDFEIWIPLE
jgi:AraC family transcriptional regulator